MRMHGLINRALENFLRDTYGNAVWCHIRSIAALPFDSFEPLRIYDPALTCQVVTAAAQVLARPAETILEDMGTFLVSHRSGERVRRLLRFGGVGFADFLNSLEELPARARLALPELALPEMRVEEGAGGEFALRLAEPFPGAGYVLMGLLRAMADDYGALALLEIGPSGGDHLVIGIQLLDEAHAEGRRFDLAAGWRDDVA
jgi:hypothetical protein